MSLNQIAPTWKAVQVKLENTPNQHEDNCHTNPELMILVDIVTRPEQQRENETIDGPNPTQDVFHEMIVGAIACTSCPLFTRWHGAQDVWDIA
jgi:hypothetical protein